MTSGDASTEQVKAETISFRFWPRKNSGQRMAEKDTCPDSRDQKSKRTALSAFRLERKGLLYYVAIIYAFAEPSAYPRAPVLTSSRPHTSSCRSAVYRVTPRQPSSKVASSEGKCNSSVRYDRSSRKPFCVIEIVSLLNGEIVIPYVLTQNVAVTSRRNSYILCTDTECRRYLTAT